MGKRIVLFVIGFLVWCLLSWVPDWQHLLVGLLAAIAITIITGDLFIQRTHLLKHPKRYWYFIFYYLPALLWAIIKANFDVAYRVLHPKLPINPGIVKVKTNLKSDTALTFLANSITLTPGTLTVDIDTDNGVLYVHWIDVKDKDTKAATEIIVGRFEKILRNIFD